MNKGEHLDVLGLENQTNLSNYENMCICTSDESIISVSNFEIIAMGCGEADLTFTKDENNIARLRISVLPTFNIPTDENSGDSNENDEENSDNTGNIEDNNVGDGETNIGDDEEENNVGDGETNIGDDEEENNDIPTENSDPQSGDDTGDGETENGEIGTGEENNEDSEDDNSQTEPDATEPEVTNPQNDNENDTETEPTEIATTIKLIINSSRVVESKIFSSFLITNNDESCLNFGYSISSDGGESIIYISFNVFNFIYSGGKVFSLKIYEIGNLSNYEVITFTLSELNFVTITFP